MIHLSEIDFRKMLQAKFGVVVKDEPGEVHIVGYRNKFGRVNYYDDTIAVYYKTYRWHSYSFQATTMPGLPSLIKPVNPKGTAILIPGRYENVYELGLHKGKYAALVQRRPMSVYRDNNLDHVYNLESRTTDTGLFGINLHRASLKAVLVGADSAGCQVIKNWSDYETLIDICRNHHDHKQFDYTLIDI